MRYVILCYNNTRTKHVELKLKSLEVAERAFSNAICSGNYAFVTMHKKGLLCKKAIKTWSLDDVLSNNGNAESMTHNEFYEFKKELVEKVLSNTDYTSKDLERDLQNVVVTPYEFADYPFLREETKAWIEGHYDREEHREDGSRVFRGTLPEDQVSNWQKEKAALNIESSFAYFYNGVGVNREEFLVYSWCEGETWLKVCKDKDAFNKEVADWESYFEVSI